MADLAQFISISKFIGPFDINLDFIFINALPIFMHAAVSLIDVFLMSDIEFVNISFVYSAVDVDSVENLICHIKIYKFTVTFIKSSESWELNHFLVYFDKVTH